LCARTGAPHAGRSGSARRCHCSLNWWKKCRYNLLCVVTGIRGPTAAWRGYRAEDERGSLFSWLAANNVVSVFLDEAAVRILHRAQISQGHGPLATAWWLQLCFNSCFYYLLLYQRPLVVPMAAAHAYSCRTSAPMAESPMQNHGLGSVRLGSPLHLRSACGGLGWVKWSNAWVWWGWVGFGR
jgi:hypothetical protein